MAYRRKMIKVQILGDAFNQQEQWTTGFWMAPNFGDASIASDAAAKLAVAWQTFFTSANVSISNKYRCVSIKTNLVGTDGKQITNPTQEYFYPVPLVGPNSGSPLPPQITLVASLRTNLPRGVATHGRMYLPGINAAVDSDARVSSLIRNNVATAMKTFFDTINQPGVSSGNWAHVTSFKGAGMDMPVTKVLIGDLYDTQRRRRNGLTEQYTTTALNAT